MPFSVCVLAYAVPGGESALGYTGAEGSSDVGQPKRTKDCKMCDCFNQIFGVTWSPTSSYGK